LDKPANPLDDSENREITKRLVDLDTGLLIEVYKGDKLKIIRQQQYEAIDKAYETIEVNDSIKD
jgi:hypothetical protein